MSKGRDRARAIRRRSLTDVVKQARKVQACESAGHTDAPAVIELGGDRWQGVRCANCGREKPIIQLDNGRN